MHQKMEKFQQHPWWRAVKSLFSYKNATVVVCLFNVVTVLLLLQGCFYSSSPKSPTSNKALYRHIKESEDIRRAMIPRELIKRVREIGQDVYVEAEQVHQKDVKQTAAEGLISRLTNFRSYSDAGSNKALEEWRKRKMESQTTFGHLPVLLSFYDLCFLLDFSSLYQLDHVIVCNLLEYLSCN